jgi:5-methyltetrahydrofolate--homocysteine methyltransferase
MNRTQLSELLTKRLLVCHGPLGALLQGEESAAAEAGHPGRIPELCALEDPGKLAEIHAAALGAGADLVLTNTFAAHAPTLQPLGQGERLAGIITGAVGAARQAIATASAAPDRPVLLGFLIGPLSPGVRPLGQLDFEAAVQAYRQVAELAAEQGPDLFVLEAFSDVHDLKAALIALREVAPTTAVIVQMEFGEEGRTASGTTPAVAWAVSRSLGAAGIGACGRLTPGEMRPIAAAFRAVSDLPLIMQPAAESSATPRPRTLQPKGFARQMQALTDEGAAIVGCWGCPAEEYVAYLRRLAAAATPLCPPRQQRLILASRGRDVEIGAERGLVAAMAWGPVAQRATRGGEGERRRVFRELGRAAQNTGVRVLEVRMNVPGGDEPGFLETVLPELSRGADCPLLITADTRKGLETALRLAPGRPLVASVWSERGRLERILPLARRYGAAVVAACMTGGALPARAEERLKVAEQLLADAIAAGMQQEDIIMDPVASAVLHEKHGLRETLRTIDLIKKELGQPTMVRLGRVAEGLDGAADLQAAFLSMAAAAGVDMVVGDLDGRLLRRAAASAALLVGRDRDARRYRALMRASEQADPRPHRAPLGESSRARRPGRPAASRGQRPGPGARPPRRAPGRRRPSAPIKRRPASPAPPRERGRPRKRAR